MTIIRFEDICNYLLITFEFAARQLGFKDGNECPELSKLASNYVRNSKGFEEELYVYLTSKKDDVDQSLCEKLVEELERCILGYFAFHWSQADLMINEVLSAGSDERKLKNMVLTATRKQRFDKVSKDLKVTQAFSTMVEEMKVIGTNSPRKGESEDALTEVMGVVAHSDRSPVLLFMGGGMGAGKSTVLKEVLKEGFWAKAAANAVVVEADAFKETDVIYQALSSKGHHNDMLQTAELVHKTSTDAASSLLVTALNDGRDVIMDGTMSWEPFVEQTIAMARSVHKYRYRMGVGYKVSDDGTITENYWEKVENGDKFKVKKPYRIEMLGVVCDPYLAVTRGIRRAIAVKRAVRVNSQLKSHKMFANAFTKYCRIVDNAKLYCTNGIGVPPQLIGWKDGNSNLLVDREQIKCLESLTEINDTADSIYELYADPKMLTDSDSVWNKAVMTPTRNDIQRDLKIVIEKIEKSKS
ncbi:P-loop containing nucleoside triphosphate hydrolases superfamily protein [Artemisia annua]|uniref:P-loop containing nucleoside triphosphate hydrolases superfamily protein n=1 Tax=Artemisia annua TaxID=35608 RepID=A0A2U1NX81_ARTAN|nr:P-loop containing nucleoside triphosphate hydrolases superfamily protein [Artemisia annua]